MKTDFELKTTDTFENGDKITLNTGFSCDSGIFLRYAEKHGKMCAVWESHLGGVYTTPLDEYRITKKK